MDAVSQVRQDKLAARFAQLDVDGDGLLSEADYRALGVLLSEGLDAGAQQREAIAGGFARLWQSLCAHADVDRDGQISLAEWAAAMGAGIAGDPQALEDAVLQTARAVIAAADVDGDGYLDLADYQRVARLLRIHGAAEAFAALDTDGDGQLSAAELTDSVRAFFVSDDPDAVGNRVFGRAG